MKIYYPKTNACLQALAQKVAAANHGYVFQFSEFVHVPKPAKPQLLLRQAA